MPPAALPRVSRNPDGNRTTGFVGGLDRTLELIEGLEVHPERMREILGLTRQLIYAEAVMMALAPHLGRQKAHDLVESAVAESRAGKSFFETLRQSRVISDVLSVADLRLIFNGEPHIEAADRAVNEVLAALTEDPEERRWNK